MKPGEVFRLFFFFKRVIYNGEFVVHLLSHIQLFTNNGEYPWLKVRRFGFRDSNKHKGGSSFKCYLTVSYFTDSKVNYGRG